MKPHDTLPPKGKLPLPSPQSPAQLDATILSHARENAPARKRALQPAWMAGVATACVVVLALFINEPQQTPQQSQQDESPEQVHSKRDRQAAQEMRTGVESQAVATAKSRATSSQTPTSPGPIALQEGAAASFAAAPSKRRESSYPLSEEASDPAVSADVQGQNDQYDMLRSQLEQCARLLDAGDQKLAQQTYRELRQRCPHCDLPDSLEKAIERYLKY